MLEWVALSSPGDLPDSGIKPQSPALEADSFPSESPGQPWRPVLNLFWMFSVLLRQTLCVKGNQLFISGDVDLNQQLNVLLCRVRGVGCSVCVYLNKKLMNGRLTPACKFWLQNTNLKEAGILSLSFSVLGWSKPMQEAGFRGEFDPNAITKIISCFSLKWYNHQN